MLDYVAIGIERFYFTRGLGLICLLWWIWFRGGPDARRDREIVVCTAIATFVALILGRALAHLLPFREHSHRLGTGTGERNVEEVG